MRKTEEIEVNTDQGTMRFSVTQLGGLAGAAVAIRLAPHLPRFVSALANSGIDFKALGAAKSGDGKGLSEALKKIDLSGIRWERFGEVLAAVQPTEFEEISIQLLKGSTAIGQNDSGDFKIDFGNNARRELDQLFAGQVWQLFKLVGFAIKLNFANFS